MVTRAEVATGAHWYPEIIWIHVGKMERLLSSALATGSYCPETHRHMSRSIQVVLPCSVSHQDLTIFLLHIFPSRECLIMNSWWSGTHCMQSAGCTCTEIHLPLTPGCWRISATMLSSSVPFTPKRVLDEDTLIPSWSKKAVVNPTILILLLQNCIKQSQLSVSPKQFKVSLKQSTYNQKPVEKWSATLGPMRAMPTLIQPNTSKRSRGWNVLHLGIKLSSHWIAIFYIPSDNDLVWATKDKCIFYGKEKWVFKILSLVSRLLIPLKDSQEGCSCSDLILETLSNTCTRSRKHHPRKGLLWCWKSMVYYMFLAFSLSYPCFLS
jgi:hypothetical protein